MKRIFFLLSIFLLCVFSLCYAQKLDIGKAKNVLIKTMPKLEEIPKRITEFVDNRGEKLHPAEILIVLQSRSDIEIDLEIITGVFYIYALQACHSTTTPQANGVLIEYMESGIKRMTIAQDRLILASDAITNKYLKGQIKKAISYIVNSKYAIQAIANNIKRLKYILPEG